MELRKSVFLALAHLIRAMPPIRGKVRAGLALYRILHRPDDRWSVEVPLFRRTTMFNLNLESAHERMALLMDGYEKETSEFLAEIYCGGSILDIGANIGLITIPLALRLQPRGARLFVFDPVPQNIRSLERQIERNGVAGNVTVFPVGLGDTDKKASIQVEEASKGSTGTGNILPEHFEFEKLPIEIRSIDSLVASGELPSDISLVKIDTDGYDLYILRGSTELLRKQRPVILAELNSHCLGWHGQTIEDAIAFLREHDYELFPEITGKGSLKFRRRFGAGFHSDALLVPREKVASITKYLSD